MGWEGRKAVSNGSSEERKELMSGRSAPADDWNISYVVFFALGVGVLLPWNAFINAVDYFDFLYPNSHIDRVFTVAYLVPCFVVLCLLTAYGDRYSSASRINGGLGAYLCSLVLVPVVDAVFIRGQRGIPGTHYATIAAVAFTGVADALVQGSAIGAAGELPERYMQAFVAGTAACGVLVSLLRIITKASFPNTPDGLRESANVYFMVSAGFLVLCVVAFNSLHKLPIMQYYRSLKLAMIREADEVAEVDDSVGPKLSAAVGVGPVCPKSSWMSVLLRIRWLAFSLCLTFIITLAIFPGFLAEDVHSRTLGDWYPVLLIGAYNVFDLVGKATTAVYVPAEEVYIIGGSIGRLIFFPLFALCLHGPPSLRSEGPVFFLTSLLGLTDGFFASSLLIVSPKLVPFTSSESAGIIMTLALVLGLAVGAIISFVWVI